MPKFASLLLRFLPLLAPPLALADSSALLPQITARVDSDYPALGEFYRDLHRHPELSLMEEKTSAKVAAKLRDAGFEVTEKFGGYGVVGVLKNGDGPVLLIRTDLDALPVEEDTGLPYASKDHVRDLSGREVSVMQACGHDIHMSIFVEVARELSALREHWNGTVLMVGQPAEERGIGARVMLSEGLYRKFPKPTYAVAIHDSASLPAGVVGTVEGYIMANVDTVEITVRGIGGHGAYPQLTKDPVVLAARIVLALQTIVSRETRPVDPAVVTVGSIHGGTKSNVIPDEVKLQLTLRSYSDAVRTHTIAAVERICRGEAIAAGMPDDRMPLVHVVEEEITPATYNDPELTRRVHHSIVAVLGANKVVTIDPEMGGEDFSQFGRTTEKIPLCLFRVGAVAPEKVLESQRTGVALPSLHSSRFAPLPEPTIKTGVISMTAVALDLLAKK